MGVQIRTPGWKLEWLHMARFDDRAKRIREFRIAVIDEIPAIIEKTPFVHGHVSGHLFHPLLIRMRRDARNLDITALKMNKEKHVLRDQAAQCEHFHGEEIGSRENGHVGANEVFPCGGVADQTRASTKNGGRKVETTVPHFSALSRRIVIYSFAQQN